MYAKVFSQIFDSSISSDHEVRHVFMDLLVMADRDGYVDMTRDAICRRANIPMTLLVRALSILSAPDPASRSVEKEGRRIELIDECRDWGWRIVNYAQYRDIRDEEGRRRYFREYQRERRQHLSTSVKDMSLTPFNKSDASHLLNSVTFVTPDTDTDTETKTDTDPERYMAHSANAGLATGESKIAQGNKKEPSHADTAPVTEKHASVAAVSGAGHEGTGTAPRQSKRFQKPTMYELKLAVAKSGMPETEATKFFNHHESKGWMIGKSPMRSWTAALGTWKSNYEERRNGYGTSHRSPSHAPAPGERFISRSDAGDAQRAAAVALHRSRNLDGPPDDQPIPGLLGSAPGV